MFVEGRGDGVHDPDEARRERYPCVAESINGLVTPSRELAPRGGGGDVAVSVTRWDDLHGLVRWRTVARRRVDIRGGGGGVRVRGAKAGGGGDSGRLVVSSVAEP